MLPPVGRSACPSCGTERSVVGEAFTAGALRLGLVCPGCNTRTEI